MVRTQTRDVRKQRAQFRSAYYYSPARPQYPYTTRGDSAARTVRTAASPVSLSSDTKFPIKVFVTIIGVLFLSILGINHLFHTPASSVAANGEPSSAPTASTPPANVTSADEMQTTINQIINQNQNVDVGVSIIDLNNHQTYTYGVTAVFLAASTGKLISASYLLHQVDSGKDLLSDNLQGLTTQEQLRRMIVDSDNDAWSAINDHLGNGNLEAYAKSIGMTDYHVVNNSLTPNDIATLLNQLRNDSLLSKSSSGLLLDYMKQANRDDFIEAALPDNVTVYHKAGWLDDRSHDAAIIDYGKHPYILVVFTKSTDSAQTTQRINIIHQITNATVAHFIDKDVAAKLATAN